MNLSLIICNIYGVPINKTTDQDEFDLATILSELTIDIDPDDIFSELEALFDDLNSQMDEIFREISIEGPFSFFYILFD
ncbi:hypothetical protein RR46_00833 [Papilio xuthus]|uniref:Uncharacterized protein n=1 Tax=Papilio xuthus TaxID=66420 RepID=A0A0N1PEZ2_PAPXU|nr:hypothetical protein RR46_00833 [Papilio xuthus]